MADVNNQTSGSETSGDAPSELSPPTQAETPDWMVPAVLVAVAALVLLVVGVAYAAGSSSASDDSPGAQLEAWTKCLESEGADVPQVDARRNGDVVITIDSELIEGDVDTESWWVAFDACEAAAPEAVQHMIAKVEGLERLQSLEWLNMEWIEELDMSLLLDDLMSPWLFEWDMVPPES